MEIKIPQTNKVIGKNQPVFIIAELGKNFIQTKEEKSTETKEKPAEEEKAAAVKEVIEKEEPIAAEEAQ